MRRSGQTYTVYIEQDEDGMYIGSIPTIAHCYAEGETMDEMMANLMEVAKLCLRNLEEDTLKKTKFVGIQNIQLSYA